MIISSSRTRLRETRMRRIAAALVVAVVTLQPPAAWAQPATTVPAALAESDWGPPTDGVQAHLALLDPEKHTCPPLQVCAGRPVLPGELPHLVLHLRNRGTETVQFSLDFGSSIELDGRWYVPGPRGGSASAARIPVEPGGPTVTVYAGLRGDFYAEGTGANEKLTLTPGRHVVRLSTRLNRGQSRSVSSAERLAVVSNPISLDISAATNMERRQTLIEQTSVGGAAGLAAARLLTQEFPGLAVDAIAAAVLATRDAAQRVAYVELAASIPTAASLVFLRSQLTPESGLLVQISAAEALRVRNAPGWEEPLLEAWRNAQDRVVPANGSDYGRLINALAKTGSVAAIDALARSANAPVDTRLAIVQAFLPPGIGRGASALDGPTANLVMVVHGEIAALPEGAAGAAIERLLAAALADKEARSGYRRTFGEIGVENPRVCDVAALVFASRWPARFQFAWSEDVARRDAQIEAIRTELSAR